MAAALAAGVEGTTPYLAQEYVAGEALDAALRQFGPPPPAEALTTLRRIADALDRAAGDNIHHGMLHPRDIRIAEGGDARVIDLGVAQALARCGLRVPVRRPYSAPERVVGEKWGGAADIFSLGAVAYELLTGRRLAGSGRPEIQAPGLSGPSADRVADVLARALDQDPAARYPSAADLVDALAPVLPNGRPGRKRAKPVSEAEPLDETPTTARPGPDAFAEPLVPAAAELPEIEIERVTPAIVEPGAAHDLEVDLDLPAPRFAALEDEPADAAIAVDRPAPPHVEEPPATVESPVSPWPTISLGQPPVVSERRPLLPLIMALVVGTAGGFGWGYWTAHRTLTRSGAAAVAAPAPATESAGAPVRVEEPEVIGERGLPSPAATPQRAPAPPPPAPAAPPRAAERPAAERKPAPLPSGRLVVRSTPAGARVLVDGRSRGRTPLVLRDLPLRVVRVTLERDGFKPDERRVGLTAAQPTVTIEAKLAAIAPPAPVATTGTLAIDSRPTGATVFLDGRQVGTTPLSLPDVTPGTHRIRLELAGFNPWVTTADVQAGARARVAASLERGIPE
jgi:PEGA domain/Protein kinase domain